MTPEEAREYINKNATLTNWKRVQIDGKYHRQCTVSYGESMNSIAITKFLPDDDPDAMDKFMVDAAAALENAIATGIVK